MRRLAVRFFRTARGNEPVRDWLHTLSVEDRRTVVEEIRTVQLGWPLGMPLVRKLGADLWEVRVRIRDGVARVVFTLEVDVAVLLHGFVKKSRKTPAHELATALERLESVRRSRRD